MQFFAFTIYIHSIRKENFNSACPDNQFVAEKLGVEKSGKNTCCTNCSKKTSEVQILMSF
jgi:hypothetical protein